MKNIFITLLLLLGSFELSAQIEGTNAFLTAPQQEVGIHTKGYEGATALPSFANNFRSPPFMFPDGFAFVSNPQDDGWVNYDGDFMTPGSFENGFGITVDGVDYNNNGATSWPASTELTSFGLSNFQTIGKCKLVDWDGTAGGVDVHMTYKMDTTTAYYSIQIVLTNTTATDKSDVYFMKTLDPDNNQTLGFPWGFSTDNTIVSQPNAFCPKALVSATQSEGWDNYFGLAGIDQNIRVSRGSFTVRTPVDVWNGNPLTGITNGPIGTTVNADQAISIAHKDTLLPAGQASTFNFVVIMASEQAEEAIASLYTITHDDTDGFLSACEIDPTVVADTVFACSELELTVEGGGIDDLYDWEWFDEDGISIATGTSYIAAASDTGSYKVIGTPIAGCLDYVIERDIIVASTGIAPGISVTDPGLLCNSIETSDVVVTDTLGLPGTLLTFYSALPDSIDDTGDIWPGGPITESDSIYVLMGDPLSNCYDVVLLEFDYVVVRAGLDSTGYLLCNSGIANVDLDSLLMDTILFAGGQMWEELVPSGGFDPITNTFDPTGLPAGDYTFQYIALGGSICLNDTSMHTVTIYDQPEAGADNIGRLCNVAGDTYDLNTLLLGHDAGGTWTDITGTGGAFDITTGILTLDGVLIPGDYNFSYTVAGDAPCIDDVSDFIITVDPIPVLNAGMDQEFCFGNTTTVNAGGDPATYVWDLGITDGVAFTPVVGTLTYEVTATDANGCVNTDDLDILVNPIPTISFTSSDVDGCVEFLTDFTITSDVAVATTDWIFGDGDVSVGAILPTVTHTYLSGGLYDVNATVTDVNGCVNDITYFDYITVEEHPVAEFTIEPQSVFTNNTEATFENTSQFATEYSWNFGDATELSTEFEPIHFFPDDQGDVFFPIELKATNYLNCVDSTVQYIKVKSIILFFIPNAFTPDGDQFNDTFEPKFESGYDPYNYHLMIFNRFGETVFESFDATIGWDGTFGNQGIVKTGVYTWAIEFKEKYTDKYYRHEGHVTVIK